jgi:large subunit ribosomal protein L38e
MPVEVKSKEEFLKVLERASECRVKLGYRRMQTSEGTRRVKVLKVKARTPSYLYTLVFENIDEGIEFVKSIRDKCSNLVIYDEEVRSKIG